MRRAARPAGAAGAWLLLAAAPLTTVMAQTPEAQPAAAAPASAPAPTIERCAAIGAPADRLICYDKLAGRSVAADVPPALQGGPTSTSTLAAKGAPTTVAAAAAVAAVAATPGAAAGSGSLLSKYWELDPSDQRGTFNFVGYRSNYVLPIHLTNRINRSPQSPTQAAVPEPDYKRQEAKFQLSLRTKVAQDLFNTSADVWLSFTQQVLWQIWTGADSKPFRNSDYEPEAMVVLPMSGGLRKLPFGWQWRYTLLSLAHQSNGQSDPLSRSWNRVYLGAGFERGDWSLTTRFNQRLKEPLATDNNPDLVQYRGRGEFQLNWAHGPHTVSVQYRSTLKNGRYGSLQADWTYPIFADQPNGLRWYVQAFSGYGETLTDYNFRQNSVGVGVAFLQF